MPLIKVYVLGYRPEESETDRPDKEGESPQKPPAIVVGYTNDPQWKMAFRHEADLHCSILNTRAVRVGAHFCYFLVEELPTGEYAIVCPEHPDVKKSS
jgi:hypothetical protein